MTAPAPGSGFRGRAARVAARCVVALAALLAAPARGEVTDLSAFGRLPVQEGGRVMPMDSFARLRLLQLSGRSTWEGRPALHWLGRLVFQPDACSGDRVFLINHPEVVEAMGVPLHEGRRYSFTELQPGIRKLGELAQAAQQHKDEERTPVEKELLRVYHNLNVYTELASSFQFAAPSGDFAITNEAARARLQVPAEQSSFSFLDIFQRAQTFASEVQQVATNPPASWTAEQAQYFQLSSALYQWSQFYRGLPIAMMPLSAHGAEQWVSPWDLLSMGFLDEGTRRELLALAAMSRAYLAGSSLEFNLAAHTFERSVRARAAESRGLAHLDLELLYNRVQPFYRAEIVYGLAFLVCLLGMLGRGDRSPVTGRRSLSAWLRRAALAGVLLALVPHTLGLVWRMMIMGRPPMTNLYATFIFVSWMCVVLGLAVEVFQRNSLGTLLASVAGLVLLMISDRFAAQGDTLGVVVAVLDSNFWLSTHVVTITMGYAGCLAAGLVGHLYLLQALRWSPDDPRLAGTIRAVYGLLAFGLIFSFLGTMLGGVWADQSWGRFWGWDPKENGALLIVLWCAILFHSRVAKLIGPVGLSAGAVLGVIVVLMAWIGINLLGVGLHSYGFTSGLARGLWTAIAIEVLFVSILVPLIQRRWSVPSP